jgi:hypothetical protein
MFIDGNSSNYLKIIDKWQPVVCADILGEQETGWDCRLELSTALHARQSIKPFKQFLKGVAIRSRPFLLIFLFLPLSMVYVVKDRDILG